MNFICLLSSGDCHVFNRIITSTLQKAQSVILHIISFLSLDFFYAKCYNKEKLYAQKLPIQHKKGEQI